MYKDCFDDCFEHGCNVDMSVGDKMNEGFDQESCYACKFVEEDDGTISGNNQCGDAPTDNMKNECPNYAQNGCYTGTAVHYSTVGIVEKCIPLYPSKKFELVDCGKISRKRAQSTTKITKC